MPGRVIHLFWGDPAPYVQAVRAAGAKLLSTVAGEDEPKRALAAGADVLIAQGWEAGGHVRGTTSTFALCPSSSTWQVPYRSLLPAALLTGEGWRQRWRSERLAR
jgi:NAD(P)H-dependent flavin oxidoreductase YrpB (nitropropane dioxygenase family)